MAGWPPVASRLVLGAAAALRHRLGAACCVCRCLAFADPLPALPLPLPRSAICPDEWCVPRPGIGLQGWRRAGAAASSALLLLRCRRCRAADACSRGSARCPLAAAPLSALLMCCPCCLLSAGLRPGRSTALTAPGAQLLPLLLSAGPGHSCSRPRAQLQHAVVADHVLASAAEGALLLPWARGGHGMRARPPAHVDLLSLPARPAFGRRWGKY